MESDKTVQADIGATLSDQVKEVEQHLLDVLITRFFPHCYERRNMKGLNIFLDREKSSIFSDSSSAQSLNLEVDRNSNPVETPPSTNNVGEMGVTGLSSSPIDLANGSK